MSGQSEEGGAALSHRAVKTPLTHSLGLATPPCTTRGEIRTRGLNYINRFINKRYRYLY